MESALKLLESKDVTRADRDSAIDVIARYVETQTTTVTHLERNETSARIAAAIIAILDSGDPDLPLSQLIWILGRINDPQLVDCFRRWLLSYVTQLKRYNAAIHNTLINLDHHTGKHRSASLIEVEENIRRADDYLDERVSW